MYQTMFLQVGGGGIGNYVLIPLMFLVLYLFMIRPQMKKQKDEKRPGLRPQSHGPVHGSGEEDRRDRVEADVAGRLCQEVRPHAVRARRPLANHEASLWREYPHARLSKNNNNSNES